MHRVNVHPIPLAVAALVAGAFAASAELARDTIMIAGSSTILPYANVVAERFQKAYPMFKVSVDSGGTSTGISLFCKGTGPEFIDIANASRPMKSVELAACVKAVVEVKFGYDGVVFASDRKGAEFNFEAKDWFLALAPEIPVGGRLAPNPNTRWNQVNDNFPTWEIAAYIPGESHGTRELFEEKVLAAGCKATGALELLKAKFGDDKKAEKACTQLRKDDGGKHAVDINGDYTETLARIGHNKTGIGVFGLAFYENNRDTLRIATMGGVRPSVETISAGTYPVSRPLFFYIKKAHVGFIPGLKEYATFFVSDKMIGKSGALAEFGLIPLADSEAKPLRDAVEKLTPMAGNP
jgi:phosphate transport system substrate-binding protein